ncbi:protein phosphatase CheZ [Xanthobacter agilis]|jgi:chemotaxis protein CheZ|uniref:Chemotaxis protein CheZ n=1 Tax=Xanthobacter agilis TaxID=47492 RepID=A0ABU0LHY2_XANAG|nr:protein phosphatase CheZ [Xanthobacter agilis]MDQ0506702.1 chemotaxis protein CheZ [Xanthobacter agilis]
MSGARRPFRIETAKTNGGNEAEGVPALTSFDSQINSILAQLGEVREEIRKFQDRDPTLARERDRSVLWSGIETIQDAIRNTRHEIATIHTEGPRGERLTSATSELEAVVSDTEGATETILSAAESIDNLTQQLVSRLSDKDLELARKIQDEVVRQFEACNFQDITGQRIRKVVKLLVFIEERVTRMTEIWGGSELVERAKEMESRDGDAALLNGPALSHDTNVVSQDDIDSLFR